MHTELQNEGGEERRKQETKKYEGREITYSHLVRKKLKRNKAKTCVHNNERIKQKFIFSLIFKRHTFLKLTIISRSSRSIRTGLFLMMMMTTTTKTTMMIMMMIIIIIIIIIIISRPTQFSLQDLASLSIFILSDSHSESTFVFLLFLPPPSLPLYLSLLI